MVYERYTYNSKIPKGIFAKGSRKIHQANSNHRKARTAILITERVFLKTKQKNVFRNKGKHHAMLEGSAYQDSMTVTIIPSNNRAPKCMENKWTEVKG